MEPAKDDGRRPGPRFFTRGFSHGLLRPSLAGLAGSVLVALIWLVLLAAALDEDFAASKHATLLAASGSDRDVPVGATALRLSRLERLELPSIVLVGASDLLEALQPLPKLEQAYREQGARVQLVDLITHWQSLLDSAVLVDMLPRQLEGAVVVMVGPKRIGLGTTYEGGYGGQPPFHRRFGFRSPLRERIAAEAGVETAAIRGNFLLDNRHFYFPRLANVPINLLFGRPTTAAHVWREPRDQPVPPAQVRRFAAHLKGTIAQYEANFSASAAMLEHMASAVAERGATLVLLETPLRAEGIDGLVGADRYAEHRRRMAALAERTGALYWDLRDRVELSSSDYRDDQHLLTQRSRSAYTRVLMRDLFELLDLDSGTGLDAGTGLDSGTGSDPAAGGEQP